MGIAIIDLLTPKMGSYIPNYYNECKPGWFNNQPIGREDSLLEREWLFFLKFCHVSFIHESIWISHGCHIPCSSNKDEIDRAPRYNHSLYVMGGNVTPKWPTLVVTTLFNSYVTKNKIKTPAFLNTLLSWRM